MVGLAAFLLDITPGRVFALQGSKIAEKGV
jgi:hypothetical protein